MNGKFNREAKRYEMEQRVCDAIGNELKVGSVVYWKAANAMAEIGHIIPAQNMPGEKLALPGEMVLVVRWQLEPKENLQLPGLLAVQVPAQTAVQVRETPVQLAPKMEPVSVGANEEGG